MAQQPSILRLLQNCILVIVVDFEPPAVVAVEVVVAVVAGPAEIVAAGQDAVIADFEAAAVAVAAAVDLCDPLAPPALLPSCSSLVNTLKRPQRTARHCHMDF